MLKSLSHSDYKAIYLLSSLTDRRCCSKVRQEWVVIGVATIVKEASVLAWPYWSTFLTLRAINYSDSANSSGEQVAAEESCIYAIGFEYLLIKIRYSDCY